jgi:hypothetical protein
MGFDCVGDLLKIKLAVANMQKEIRSFQRDNVIWEGEKFIDAGCCRLSSCFNCCFAEIPRDKYKLTATNLSVTLFTNDSPSAFLTCCYPTKRGVDNIALASIKDVDLDLAGVGCIDSNCCGKNGFARLVVSHKGSDVDDNSTDILIQMDKGLEVQKMLRDAISENHSVI